MTDPASTDPASTATTPSEPAQTPTAPAETAPTETAPTDTAPAATAPTETAPAEGPRKIPWGGIAAVVVFLGVALVTQRTRHNHGGFGGMPTPAGPGSNQMGGGRVGPMNPAELALFAPLAVGSALGPATVVSLESGNGTLTINVTFGTTPQTFRVARVNSTTTSMHLRATGPYTVYLVGNGTGTDRASIERAWRALEAVLAHHTSAPVPSNLSPCCPFNGSAA